MDVSVNNPGLVSTEVPPKLCERPGGRFPVAVLVALIVAFAAGVLFIFNPSEHGFFPRCYFHAATGLNCPGCGSLRALHQLLHGHIVEAIRLNALLMLGLSALAWRGVRMFTARRRGEPAALTIPPRWLWTFLFVAVAFTVLRNVPAFGWLAP